MGALANTFALLADQQGKEASTIVALKSTEVKKIAEKKKKIAEEKRKAEAKKKKKKKKSSLRDGGRGQEGHGPGQKSNTGDGQVNQEHKAVNHHGNENQEKASVRTVVLSKEALRERWLAREKERKEEEAKRKEQWLSGEAERQERWVAREAALAREAERKARSLAREAEREERRLAREEEKKKEIEEKRKKEMTMKTLQEHEEQKAYEKQKAEKATLSVPEPPVKEAILDNIYTKQKSKDETDIKKYCKVHKTMSIKEFLKLPTGREGQDGPGRGNREYALPDEDNTVKGKEGPAPDLSETSFPALGKATKPTKLYWEDGRKDNTY